MGEGTAVKGVVVLNFDANDWKGWERWGVGGRGYCGDGGGGGLGGGAPLGRPLPSPVTPS